MGNSVSSKWFKAVKGGDVEKVKKYLVKHPGVFNYMDNDGFTALFISSMNPDTAILELLLEQDVDLEAEIDSFRWTSLHFAAINGRAPAVSLLLQAGSQIYATDRMQQTALHRACGGGFEDVVKVLLGAGAELEGEDSNGQTPLHHAAKGGHSDVVILLLESGADYQTEDKDGKNAVDCASNSQHMGTVELIQQWIDHQPINVIV